jgi:hypothetical protein
LLWRSGRDVWNFRLLFVDHRRHPHQWCEREDAVTERLDLTSMTCSEKRQLAAADGADCAQSSKSG